MSDSSRNASDAVRTVSLFSRLMSWSRATGQGTDAIVGDLAEIHDAIHVVANCIERLATEPPLSAEVSREVLTNLDAWLNDELGDHVSSLNQHLESILKRLYEVDARRPSEDG